MKNYRGSHFAPEGASRQEVESWKIITKSSVNIETLYGVEAQA